MGSNPDCGKMVFLSGFSFFLLSLSLNTMCTLKVLVGLYLSMFITHNGEAKEWNHRKILAVPSFEQTHRRAMGGEKGRRHLSSFFLPSVSTLMHVPTSHCEIVCSVTGEAKESDHR